MPTAPARHGAEQSESLRALSPGAATSATSIGRRCGPTVYALTSAALILALGHSANAAEARRSVNLMVGLAFAFPIADNAPKGSGIGQLWAAEYVLPLAEEAVTLRPYAGVLSAVPSLDCDKGVRCEVSAKIGFAGGKFRVLAIPR